MVPKETAMTSFESDYNNGAHPEILRRLLETNDSQSASYGYDEWSDAAREKIREACQCPDADIFFLVGGTQVNATVIDAKVITLPSHNGKMLPEDLSEYMKRFYADPTWEHMAFPGMVYITFPTELGTLYSSAEIEQIYATCQKYQIPLFVDGARLGYGLMAEKCDIDLPWLAHHCDAFYIGGTKVGAFCGEAVVFPQGAPTGFFTIVKRHGALLAKSRIAGVQFDALFTNNLYFQISRHALVMASRLRQLFIDAGIPIKDSPTNQQFVVLTNTQLQLLMSKVLFETWEPIDDEHTLCRFVTSWATTEADIEELSRAIKSVIS